MDGGSAYSVGDRLTFNGLTSSGNTVDVSNLIIMLEMLLELLESVLNHIMVIILFTELQV